MSTRRLKNGYEIRLSDIEAIHNPKVFILWRLWLLWKLIRLNKKDTNPVYIEELKQKYRAELKEKERIFKEEIEKRTAENYKRMAERERAKEHMEYLMSTTPASLHPKLLGTYAENGYDVVKMQKHYDCGYYDRF